MTNELIRIASVISELEQQGRYIEADSLLHIMHEIREAGKNHGGLDDWFQEKWVDVRRPKKGGGYHPCGRGDTSKGKKPVCTPANKAKNLDKKERSQRLKEKAKKEREPNPDKKPNTTQYSEGAGGKSNQS